ncbi:MAG: S46 family peptidase [Bacteroidales bacterium]|nr:S46 family peptidase [Bacteroidales bacterium]
MTKQALLTFLISIISLPMIADEGMWLLPWLNQKQMDAMHKAGLTLTREDLYTINHPGIKDAIAIFDQGCTGSIISEDGLILTNHHCGYDAIRALSTESENLLEDGFWSENQENERPAPGVTAAFLVEIRDVTRQIRNETDTITDPVVLDATIEALYYEISTRAIRGTHYEAEVAPFFGGAQYLLMIYEVYKDIRLVATPPASVGKFGGEADNWSWPRHTGDFSMFRIYTDREGKPAAYNEDNIPLKPKYVLPISTAGYQEGDFSMIPGYPGSTRRYITSFETRETIEIDNAVRVEVREKKLETMKAFMDKDPAIELDYTGKYYSASNYLKYSAEQNKALIRQKIPEKKLALETRFTQWANSNDSLSQKYAGILPRLRELIEEREPVRKATTYINEVFPESWELFDFAQAHYSVYRQMNDKEISAEKIKSTVEVLKIRAGEFFKDYNPEVDKSVMKVLLPLFRDKVPEDYHPWFFRQIRKKYHGDTGRYLDDLYAQSIFTDSARLASSYLHPELKTLKKDPAFDGMMSILGVYMPIYAETIQSQRRYDETMRKYIEALRIMDENLGAYPDANFTLRLSWGNVQGYSPGDGMEYKYYTTLKGVMEKDKPGVPEFRVPEKLKNLYFTKDFGRWKDQQGALRVCFLTTNDITGGNSGSPVLNGKGEIIGLAFDGNQDGMGGDLFYDANMQRTICVDIRYVLFLIEKLGDAGHLVKEMKLH